jgi:nucleotide-binding universal stress UspA family protein
MKKVLVPTDFSEYVNSAIDFAVQSARVLSMEVTLLHAVDMNDSIYLDHMGFNAEFNQSLLNEARDKLLILKNSIESTEGISVKTYIYKGPVKEAILTAAEENFDLIVMGTHGAGGLKEKIWGSHTAAIIGNSKVPVIVIPYEYEWKKPGKILIATNHFEKDPAVLDFPLELADLFDARVYGVVHTSKDTDEYKLAIAEYEKMLKANYKTGFFAFEHIVGSGFEVTLEDYIEKNGIDLMVMFAYHRKFIDSLFHPSMTRRMSYHTRIPLLVIPANWVPEPSFEESEQEFKID